MDLPGVPAELLQTLAASAGPGPIALVGGAVRDLLLHRVHQDPWRGLPDLDLVVEGLPAAREAAAVRLARRLEACSDGRLLAWREHGAYGTVELELAQATAGPIKLDVATARREHYPVAGDNPVVCFGRLVDDLARRDFTINAMALRLTVADGDAPAPDLLDPHGGQADLQHRLLRLLHPASLRDDPTRLVRAARYAARLGFSLAPESALQVSRTLALWPWAWRPGDPPAQAPAGLGTRLRMELELLLEREPWPRALEALQGWGGLVLLDPALQSDPTWRRRLGRADRLGLPRMVALIATAADPLGLAQRLQLPHRQQHLLQGLEVLRQRLAQAGEGDSALHWTNLLEGHGLPSEAVALALAAGVGPRRPLLRWWLRWRHLGPGTSARELMAAGLPSGPALGERLRGMRAARLQRERP